MTKASPLANIGHFNFVKVESPFRIKYKVIVFLIKFIKDLPPKGGLILQGFVLRLCSGFAKRPL